MKKLSLILVFVTFLAPVLRAQDAVGIAIELIVTQKGDQGVDFKATVTDEENSEPVAGLTLLFSGNVGGQDVALGEAETNASGVAELKNADWSALRKAGHQFTLKAAFKGNDDFLENEATVDVKEVMIDLKAEVVDSVNYIMATVTTWDEKGETIPFAEGEVKLYVPRMFSLLPIGDITTDEDGYGELKFPTDLPAGTTGELTVIARIEEDENFANAEASIPTSWGVKIDAQASKLPRALWSPDAPLWMVITFVILMGGVWYHYGLIVYELIRVHRQSKPTDQLDYSE